MNECPYCKAEIIKRLSTANEFRELSNCYNVFVNGELYDKRNRTCYNRQIFQQTAELAAMTTLKDEWVEKTAG